ncbi:hypothetical protein ABTM60_19325, partial [Acinetobacter baumannii]
MVDKEIAPGVKAFYRIFYVLEGGNYFFTKSVSTVNKKPVAKKDTLTKDISPVPVPDIPSMVNNTTNNNPTTVPPKPIAKEEVKKRF